MAARAWRTQRARTAKSLGPARPRGPSRRRTPRRARRHTHIPSARTGLSSQLARPPFCARDGRPGTGSCGRFRSRRTLARIDSETAATLLASVERLSPSLSGPNAKHSLDQLEAQHADLLTALAWFIEERRPDEALRFANGLYRFWLTNRRFEEGADWFGRVLESGDGDDRLRGRALLHAGFMPFWMGDDERASALFGQSLEVARRLGDSELTSQALGGLARVALRTDVAEGRRLAHEALQVSVAAGNETGRSNALHLLGVGAQIAGDLLEARDWMSERLTLVRQSGNDFLVASEAANLSMVERQLGNLPVAERLEREVLEISERIGDQFTKPFAIAGMAAIAVERRAYERAAILVGAAEELMEAQKMAWPPDERPHYDRMLEALPAAMGPAQFEKARAYGRALSTEQAVAFALSEETTLDLSALPGPAIRRR